LCFGVHLKIARRLAAHVSSTLTELTSKTLVEIRNAIASKQVSATDATKAVLSRIETHDGALHAYNEVYADRALARAQQVDAGEVSGSLAGVPIAIKDNLCTDYGKTTCSSRMLENFKAPYTGTAVAKLEAAGAVILGKTNLDEFAMGSSTENAAFGATKNPWDTSRVPGGSSGGSAAAMAARLCAGALGSDTGGSIRQPASFCGVVGLKPTYGRVSRYGLVAFASSLDQIGPMTATVEDAAALLNVISGHDGKDSTSAVETVPDYTENIHQPIEGARIGLAKQYLSDGNSEAVKQAVDNAIKVYESLGAQMVEVDLPHTEYGIPTYYIVAPAEASSNLARYDGVHYGHRTDSPKDLIDLYAQSRAEGFGEEVKRRIMLGTYALSAGYADKFYHQALKVRRLIKQDFDAAFKKCDAILTPVATGPAFSFGENADDLLAMYMNDVYTVTANLAGIPGVSLPGGFDDCDGKRLPIGVQLLGAHFDEAKLLRIARMFEQATEFHQQVPVM
jgi:aspartyl-tRNA(Asn)/glutamyl-tRNA(Gln) amidotransferase subunit A